MVIEKDDNGRLFELVEITTKGPEAELPKGYVFYDKGGASRKEIRVQWWNSSATTWRDIAMSVPDPADLPDSPLPTTIKQDIYPKNAKPVFFGHYWLTGKPVLQAQNALCLDYSAGTDGPLAVYCMQQPDARIETRNILTFG